MRYFDKYKQDMFPEIKDWTAPPREHIIRFGSIKNMPYKYWIFFHPSAYHLIKYSYKIMTIIIFGAGAIYTALKELWIIMLLCLFITITVIPQLVEMLKTRKLFRDMTFYDLWMRET